MLPATTFFQAAPYFFLAILLRRAVRDQARLVPANSGYDTTCSTPGFNWSFITSVLDHAVLPALTIVVASVAGWIIGMRNMMVTTMDEDYVLVAQAKGLPPAAGDQVRGPERASCRASPASRSRSASWSPARC